MNVYCERCQTATATVHVTDLEGVKKIERHLCEDCANSLGLPLKNAQGLSMLEVFQQFMEKSSSGRRRGDRACPECGMTFTEFKQKGRFGCSRDYDEFLSRLVPLLQRIHGAAEHTEGAAPEPEPPKRRWIPCMRHPSPSKRPTPESRGSLAGSAERAACDAGSNAIQDSGPYPKAPAARAR